jgi:hypothetical protein
MKKLALVSLFTLLFFNISAYAANLYFYGGDWEPSDPNADGLLNENNAIWGGAPYGAATYQNFVAGTAITVTGLFTNNASDYTPTSGYWEIRSGVSEGNGGTLIASGTGNVTNTPTGRSGFGLDEYNNTVAGLNVSLSANTYWFAVVPTCTTCVGGSYNTNSLHAVNAVGTQISGQQYWNFPYFGTNFMNANLAAPDHYPSFSSGVYAYVTPEPSSFVMLGSGLLAAVGVVRRRM